MTATLIFPADSAFFFLERGCGRVMDVIRQFHQFLLGFELGKKVEQIFVLRDIVHKEALASPPVSYGAKDAWQLLSMSPCVHTSVCMAPSDHRPGIAKLFSNCCILPCQWVGWSIIHLLLCDSCRVSCHQSCRCC
jgi:hypothetical protein